MAKLVMGEVGNFPDLARFYHDEVIHRGMKVFEHALKLGMARGEFRRTIVLPVGLRLEAAQAVFEHGILTFRIPKLEEVKPRRIEVKVR